MAQKIDVLEVFCSDESKLTHQTHMLGGKAIRSGLDQGDLHQSAGRAKLFRLLCKHRLEHVGMSPVCKPWSKWSQFNSQRSLEMWDRIQDDRKQMLVQVALCFVLCRHQVRNTRHAHWEQPKGSLMLQLPYLKEIFRYMCIAQPDLCRADDLRDPENQMPIKKGLSIATTSKSLFLHLNH